MNPPRRSLLILIVADLSPRSSRYNSVSNLPADATLKMLAATIKARWNCEQAHQQLKEELGLDHFEGRSWVGLHRHALMTMIAYAFLQARRLKAAGRKKKSRGAAATTEHASYPTGDLEHLHKASATSEIGRAH